MGDKDAKLRQSILDALAQRDGPLMTPDVLKLLHCGEQFTKTNINCALYHMKSAGLIERIESQPPAWQLPGRGGAEPRLTLQTAPVAHDIDTNKGGPAPLFSAEPTVSLDNKKVKLESCASDDDVDKFSLTPPVQQTHRDQTGSPASVNLGSHSLFNPPSTSFSHSQIPAPSPFVNHFPSTHVVSPSVTRASAEQDDANFVGTQRNVESTQPASQMSRNAPSPFFPAAYSGVNANSFPSPSPSPSPPPSLSPAENLSTFRSVSPNSFNPVASTPARPTQPNLALSAAAVKADPWAATATPSVKPNFARVRPSGVTVNKPPTGHGQTGVFPSTQPIPFNRFDEEFGEALPDLPEPYNPNFSAHKPGNSFQQLSHAPKLPTFNMASRANQTPSAVSNGSTNQFNSQPASFQKRKTPGIESQTNPVQFSQPDQKRTFPKRVNQDLNEEEMPEGGVAGKSKWFAISGKKRVTVEYWKGQPLVSIREYYLDNGTMKPGKKGVSLTIEQWVALKGHIGSVDMAIKELSGL